MKDSERQSLPIHRFFHRHYIIYDLTSFCEWKLASHLLLLATLSLLAELPQAQPEASPLDLSNKTIAFSQTPIAVSHTLPGPMWTKMPPSTTTMPFRDHLDQDVGLLERGREGEEDCSDCIEKRWIGRYPLSDDTAQLFSRYSAESLRNILSPSIVIPSLTVKPRFFNDVLF